MSFWRLNLRHSLGDWGSGAVGAEDGRDVLLKYATCARPIRCGGVSGLLIRNGDAGGSAGLHPGVAGPCGGVEIE